ncbi:hypothetical protein Taro_035778 [Colocasia esculenta]|uniref:Ycf20-like protein n=1 Tax=Colocasia esculenta TaxID=4460 RepID=A0A843VVG3_COLES|nr:hypothetical protein [Colocasia esculenta]
MVQSLLSRRRLLHRRQHCRHQGRCGEVGHTSIGFLPRLRNPGANIRQGRWQLSGPATSIRTHVQILSKSSGSAPGTKKKKTDGELLSGKAHDDGHQHLAQTEARTFSLVLIMANSREHPESNPYENVSYCVIHHITNMGLIMIQSAMMVLDNEFLENPSPVHRVCSSMQSWEVKTNIRQQFYGFGSKHMFGRESSCRRQDRWRTSFALDTGGTPANGGQENLNGDSPGLGRTRLGTIVRTAGKQLLEKLNSARKNFPTKIFLLLLGFYTANALATILGQTGDWDVLVAGVVVAAIEGIGMLMYKRSTSMRTGRFQSLLEMVNFWKAGVCLGLFVDAFKLGS